jgi:hypothetical protein
LPLKPSVQEESSTFCDIYHGIYMFVCTHMSYLGGNGPSLELCLAGLSIL